MFQVRYPYENSTVNEIQHKHFSMLYHRFSRNYHKQESILRKKDLI